MHPVLLLPKHYKKCGKYCKFKKGNEFCTKHGECSEGLTCSFLNQYPTQDCWFSHPTWHYPDESVSRAVNADEKHEEHAPPSMDNKDHSDGLLAESVSLAEQKKQQLTAKSTGQVWRQLMRRKGLELDGMSWGEITSLESELKAALKRVQLQKSTMCENACK